MSIVTKIIMISIIVLSGISLILDNMHVAKANPCSGLTSTGTGAAGGAGGDAGTDGIDALGATTYFGISGHHGGDGYPGGGDGYPAGGDGNPGRGEVADPGSGGNGGSQGNNNFGGDGGSTGNGGAGGTGTSEVSSVCTFDGTVINEPYKIIE